MQSLAWMYSHNMKIFHKFGGRKTQLDFSNLAATVESNEFCPMFNNPPDIFSAKFIKLSPSQRKPDTQTKKILSLCKMNPWICQKRKIWLLNNSMVSSGVCKKNRRKLINWFREFNLFTSLDAYPFSNEHGRTAEQRF